MATVYRSTSFLGGEGGAVSIRVPERICGLSTLKPQRILPLSPTNIIPSGPNSLFCTSSSSGMAGRIPPSYQIRSTGGREPFAGYLKRTEQAVGKEKSFWIWKGVTPLKAVTCV